MISLAGKAALITGGSRGIGAAAVKLFAQAGGDVVFSYNSAKEAAKQVEQEAAKHGTRVEAFKADVGKHDDNRKLVEHTIKRLGRLDILVPNAGIISLTKGLATELARHGILVNSVAPGWVATDMSNPVLDSKAGQKMAATVIALGRAG